jgi:hypothetical protein
MHDRSDRALLEQALKVAIESCLVVCDNRVPDMDSSSECSVLEFWLMMSQEDRNLPIDCMCVLIKTKRCNYHRWFYRLTSMHESLKNSQLHASGAVSKLLIHNYEAADGDVSISIVR